MDAGTTAVRQFFGWVNQHMRWELNDLCRRLDERPAAVSIDAAAAPTPPITGSSMPLTPNHHRVLQAIETLPEDEREAFGLVRVQGLTHIEAADVIGVSAKTVRRRLIRAMILLCKALELVRPA